MDRWLSSAHDKQVRTRPDWGLQWSTNGVSSIAHAVPLHIHRPGHKFVYAVCMHGKASRRASTQHYGNPAMWIASHKPDFHTAILYQNLFDRARKNLHNINNEGLPSLAGLRNLGVILPQLADINSKTSAARHLERIPINGYFPLLLSPTVIDRHIGEIRQGTRHESVCSTTWRACRAKIYYEVDIPRK